MAGTGLSTGTEKCRNCKRWKGGAGRGLCGRCHDDPEVLAKFPAEVKRREHGKICRHCGTCPVNRPRGLCWGCYHKPGVKDKYPSTSKYASRGAALVRGAAPLPPEPTPAMPGTPEKIAVMEARLRRGHSLFHPLDGVPLEELPPPPVPKKRGCFACGSALVGLNQKVFCSPHCAGLAGATKTQTTDRRRLARLYAAGESVRGIRWATGASKNAVVTARRKASLPPRPPGHVPRSSPVAFKTGDRVAICAPENPRLHDTEAVVQELTEWGAHLAAPAAATGQFRALFSEMRPVGVPVMAARQVRESGYTGNSCARCQGVRMVRTGPCERCEDCGETSGGCG